MTGEEDFLSSEREITPYSKTTCFGFVKTISSHGRDVIYEGKTSCFAFKGMGKVQQATSVLLQKNADFMQDNDYAKDLQNKLDAYRELSKDKRTLHLVMVTTNGVAHNNYYNMVQKEITMDELF